MSNLKNPNDLMFQKLAEGLDSTSKLTHALLTEIRDSEADFASIKTELANLRDNVKGLSVIIRDGNGATSLITKIALIEKQLEDIDEWIDEHDDLEQQIIDINKRLIAVERHVNDQLETKKLEDKNWRESIHREQELAHEKKIAIEKADAEKQKFKIGIVTAVIVGIVGLIFKLLLS